MNMVSESHALQNQQFLYRAMPDSKRYFSLWCPSWPVASAWLTLGSKPAQPTVVFDREDNKAHVIAVCPDAYVAGVRRGMRQRSAQAIIPDAYFSTTDPLSETKTFARVLEIVRDMVPSVSLVRPGRLECDARGPSRYFGGDLLVSRTRALHLMWQRVLRPMKLMAVVFLLHL